MNNFENAEMNNYEKALEMCLGQLVPIGNQLDLKILLDNLKDISGIDANIDSESLWNNALEFADEGSRISYACLSKLADTYLIALLLESEEEPLTEETLTDEYGVLAYVHNTKYPVCSELGDIFLEKREKGICRIA